jgi:uncharacterized protein (TIGR04222 family)
MTIVIRRGVAAAFLVLGTLLGVVANGGVAQAQFGENIDRYAVSIQIQDDGSLRITETIDYDFGASERHGIFRQIPTRLRYDDTFDRVYPLSVESISATGGASAAFEIEQADGGMTNIKIGDADATISGAHRYTIVYTVGTALNGFDDHDELYWNAIGPEWATTINEAVVTVQSPALVTDVACFRGSSGATLSCDETTIDGSRVRFAHGSLGAYEGLTVVVAMPKGAVPEPSPVLEERWALDRAFSRTPATTGASGLLLIAIVGGLGWLFWRTGRDRRFAGSQVDQVMGNPSGEDEAVPMFDADAEGPVEFAPPANMRPGQMGTLVDERANTLDVSATIVDLAVRGHLMIQEIPKEGWFGKADWTLIKLDDPGDGLLSYEERLLDALFQDGTEVTVSSLRNTFAARLERVEESMYVDAVNRGWFRARPDRVRQTWLGRGVGLFVSGIGLTFVFARWTRWGLIGIPVVIGGIIMIVGAARMPSRTAAGTAMLRRVRGFRRVIETAETHMAQWAEEEMIFTRFLPYAVVFGCTDRWAKAFEAIGVEPDTAWYVSSRPFVFHEFAESMDGFAVTTGGTIASTPSGSGSSGFGGGGSSGGGGGGGGGGSW